MIDRKWLLSALAPAGPSGRLVKVTERPGDAFNSEVVHLELDWEGGPEAPSRLVWKRGRDDREVDVYGLFAARDGLPVPRCWAADENGLLLEDLSETHEPPVSREELVGGDGVPPGARAERVVEALAEFHAAWWEYPVLGSGVAEVRDWFRDAGCHDRHRERRRRELGLFLESEPRSEFRDLYTEALAGLEALWTPAWADRVATGRHLTLVHGDAYLNQFLVPHGEDGPAVLLDFGDATAAPGAWDLAFLMTTFWTREQRREGGRERELLRRYHERSAEAGLTQTWDELLADYRRMIAYLVFDPVWNCTDGSSRGYWEPKMRCLAAAWRDWDCASLAGTIPPS